MSAKKDYKAAPAAQKPAAGKEPMVFKKENYVLLIVSVLVILVGFLVMNSGKDKPFDDPIKITVAPVIVLIGFAIGVFSIMYTPKSVKEEEGKTPSE